MSYEEFKKEVESILVELGRPASWSEIKGRSSKLAQQAPYHSYVHKLRGEIGLIEVKDKGKKLWALRRWFKSGKQTHLVPPEKITVTLLCKAKEVFSKKYGPTHCLAGLDKNWAWKRLYPLSADIGAEIGKWDVIEAAVMDFFPECNRPETIKIWPKEVKCLDRVENLEQRKKIISRMVETGEFLHKNSWRGKTLGLIKPIKPTFFIDESEIKCHFYCNRKACKGHTFVVWDSEVTQENFRISSTESYFLLGTHKYHPHKWLLISVITLARSIPQTHLKSFISY